MGAWLATIVETGNRKDFWEAARRHGVEPLVRAVPNRALIDCEIGGDWRISLKLAETLSREFGTNSIGFVVQTVSDVHVIHVFHGESVLRRLEYSRDEGGWKRMDGTPQPFELAYCFGHPTGSRNTDPDLGEQELARWKRAEASQDAEQALDLFAPTSTEPMISVCRFLGISGETPHARLPSRRTP